MLLQTKNGVLYKDGIMLSAVQADYEANKQGFAYAEMLVKHLEKQEDKGIGKEARVGVGVFVFNPEINMFLLGKRKGSHGEGEWSLPGGHLEWMENMEDTVRRELEEETGITDISNLRKLGFTEKHYPELDKHYITLFFACESEQLPELKEPEKCEGWLYCSLKFPPEPMFCGTKKIIAEEMKKQKPFRGESL